MSIQDSNINSELHRENLIYPILDFGFTQSTFFCETIYYRCGLLTPKTQKEYVLENGLIVKNNKRYLTKKIKKDKVISFDSETYLGKCKLLCLSENDKTKQKFILRDNFKSDIDFFEACLEFLMYKSGNTSYYRFFYNIDFDISSIFKLWNDIPKIKLMLKGIKVKYKDYSFSWLKSRMFIIRYKKHTVYFTDLFNFFKIGLSKASKEFLKNEIKYEMDGNLMNTSLNYWNDNLNDIIDYCIQDCYITSLLGKELIECILDVGIELPKFLVSSASLSKQDFRYKCRIPKIEYIPQKILQIAYDCYFGGRFEMLRCGYFEKLFLYDINSQYPYFIQNLPNLKYGGWCKYENLKELPKLQSFGYFYAKLQIPESNYLSTIPIMYKGSIKFVNGYIEKWFTWYDLDLMREYIIEIPKCYLWIQDKNAKKRYRQYKPFKKRIKELYKQKFKYKGVHSLKYNLTKLCMNALYGCFIEQHKNYDIDDNLTLTSGVLFNSVYASQITAFGRWSVIREIPKSMYKHIIAIHTDSIITDKKMDFLKCNLRLGNWNLETKGKGIVLNTGMYQIGYITKTRGIPKKYIKNWLRFCLKYKSLDLKEFEIIKMKKISSALISDKDLTKVNTMVKEPKTIALNQDFKRTWLNKFNSFNDLLTKQNESYPLMCIYYNKNDVDVFPNPICC